MFDAVIYSIEYMTIALMQLIRFYLQSSTCRIVLFHRQFMITSLFVGSLSVGGSCSSGVSLMIGNFLVRFIIIKRSENKVSLCRKCNANVYQYKIEKMVAHFYKCFPEKDIKAFSQLNVQSKAKHTKLDHDTCKTAWIMNAFNEFAKKDGGLAFGNYSDLDRSTCRPTS